MAALAFVQKRLDIYRGVFLALRPMVRFSDLSQQRWGPGRDSQVDIEVVKKRLAKHTQRVYNWHMDWRLNAMIKPQPYSHDDFMRNPGKYFLFRTAKITEAISSIPELTVGQIVNIRYFATCFNKVRGSVEMPVYQVWVDDNENLRASPVMVYACALRGFVL